MSIESIRTYDGINLKGMFIRVNSSEKVCLFIPGCCGNFLDNDFIRIIGAKLQSSNYNVMCANTRGSFMMNSSFHPQNLEKPKQIGVAYERFEDCIYDIDAWINYLLLQGFRQIDVICHSSGTNKLIYYMNCDLRGKAFINNIIFLSPPDFANRIRSYDDYSDLLMKAKKNIEQGNNDKLIKVHFFYKTSSTFLDMMMSKNFDNLPLVNGNEKDFLQYSNINRPIFIIYGSKENYIKNYIDKLIMYAHRETPVKIFEIADADHIYFGKEEEVGKQIANCLNESYFMNLIPPLSLTKEIQKM